MAAVARCVSGAGLADLAAPRGCYKPLTRARWIGGTGGGYYQQCCCLCTVPVRTVGTCGGKARAVEDALWSDTLLAVGTISPALIDMARPELEQLAADDTPLTSLLWPSWPGSELLAMSPMPCFCLSCAC
jgi:hypothetical protein